MRIAVGGIVHETNTYAVEALGVTGIDRFDVDPQAWQTSKELNAQVMPREVSVTQTVSGYPASYPT